MTDTAWFSGVGISEIHLADGRHDGYVDIYVGLSFNQKGLTAIERHLTAKVKGIDSVAADTRTKMLKIIAKRKSDGTTLTNGELRKLAHSAIRSLKAKAATLSEEELLAFTTGISNAELMAVMAGHSEPKDFDEEQ